MALVIQLATQSHKTVKMAPCRPQIMRYKYDNK